VHLTDCFTEPLAAYSWSAVALELYRLKLHYAHVLRKPWVAAGLIEHSRTRRQPEVVTIDEAGRIFAAAPKQSYRVFFLTRYSLGLLLRYSLGLLFGQFQAKSSLILGPDDGVWRSALLRAPSSHFVTHGQEARKMNGDRER